MNLYKQYFDTFLLDDTRYTSQQPSTEDFVSYNWDSLPKSIREYSENKELVNSIYRFISLNDFSSLVPDPKEIDLGPIEQEFDVQTEKKVKSLSPDSTSSGDINEVNRAYRARLSEETEMFVQALLRTDFEDGMENDLTEEVEGYIRENALATYSWLASIYSANQKNENVIAGLLRIIAMDVADEDYDVLLPIVKAGLCDYGSIAQEAAVMVIEKWRTKNCLDALQTAVIQTPWIKSYAKRVEEELIRELGYAAG